MKFWNLVQTHFISQTLLFQSQQFQGKKIQILRRISLSVIVIHWSLIFCSSSSESACSHHLTRARALTKDGTVCEYCTRTRSTSANILKVQKYLRGTHSLLLLQFSVNLLCCVGCVICVVQRRISILLLNARSRVQKRLYNSTGWPGVPTWSNSYLLQSKSSSGRFEPGDCTSVPIGSGKNLVLSAHDIEAQYGRNTWEQLADRRC